MKRFGLGVIGFILVVGFTELAIGWVTESDTLKRHGANASLVGLVSLAAFGLASMFRFGVSDEPRIDTSIYR
jgi:hypothetical protein